MAKTCNPFLPGAIRVLVESRKDRRRAAEQELALYVGQLLNLVPAGLKSYFPPDQNSGGTFFLCAIIDNDDQLGWDKVTPDELRDEYGIKSMREFRRLLGELSKAWDGLVEVELVRHSAEIHQVRFRIP